MLSRKLAIPVLFAIALGGLAFYQLGPQRADAQEKVERAKGTAFIEGRVFDARTKAPIAGAKVSMEGDGYLRETVTDARGHYRVEGISPGDELGYGVGAKDYSVRSNYGANEDEEVRATAQGLQLDFAMVREATTGGQVRDSAGHPIAGAHVQIFSLTGDNNELVVTDKAGNWSVGRLNVPYPQAQINLKIQVFDPRFSQVETKVELHAGEETKFNIAMPARAVITGIVTRNGKPLANASVILDKSEGNGFINDSPNYGLPPDGAATDKNGRYRLLVSAPSTIKVSFYDDDSVGQEVAVKTRPGQTLVLNRDLKPFPFGSLSGRVLDLSGKPLVGGYIELWDENTSEAMTAARTDKNGRFRVAKVAPYADYRVKYLPPDSVSEGARGEISGVRVSSYRTTNVTIRVDTVKPQIAAPQAPRVVSGTAKVRYQASDNVGVSYVTAILDGKNLDNGQQDSTVEYEKQPRQANGAFTWDTRTVANGRHVLSLEATDEAGNGGKRQWFVWTQNKRAPAVK